MVEIFSRERETTSTIFVEDDLTLCILDFVFIYVSMINVRKQLWFNFGFIITSLGGWLANSVQLQLQLPIKTELGNFFKSQDYENYSECYDTDDLDS